jgi:hypothetical protein
MDERKNNKRILEAVVLVHRVDLVNREMVALVEGDFVTFYVPPDCSVALRGERVKLRMVQPRDRVRVNYWGRDFPVATMIEVQPASLLPFSHRN